MPSKTKRKYRGGGDNLSRCKKWVNSNNLSDKELQCDKMQTKITFPSTGMMSGWLNSEPTAPPVAPIDVGDISKGTPINFNNWDTIYNGLFNPSSAPAPAPYPVYSAPAQVKQLPRCTAYNNQSGKNVFKTSNGNYSELCDSKSLRST